MSTRLCFPSKTGLVLFLSLFLLFQMVPQTRAGPPSDTASISASRSRTASRSMTGSFSPTRTRSASVSFSQSITPSQTMSASVTPSRSASASETPSQSATLSQSTTPSHSATTSETPSQTATASITPSRSVSISGTPSHSITVSVTPSRTVTASVTPSSSVTPSETLSQSVTASVTPSSSVTPSHSASASVTPSETRSQSVTPSHSVSASVSRSRTTSASPSVTGSCSPTSSLTPTMSRTVSPTASPSASNEPAQVTITKDSGVTTLRPQQDLSTELTYTITIENTGIALAAGEVSVIDFFPSPITEIAGISCTASHSSADCGTSIVGFTSFEFLPNLPKGKSITITVTAKIQTSINSKTTVTNTASVRLFSGNVVVTDLDTVILQPETEVAVTKTRLNTPIAGRPVTYSITVSNNGPNDAVFLSVNDILTDFQSATWDCVVVSAATCDTPTGGISSIVNDNPKIFNGGAVVYRITANIWSSASGVLANTASVTVGGDVTDNTADDVDTTSETLTRVADLELLKTGTASQIAGETVTYTITVINRGPSQVYPGSVSVLDVFPNDLQSLSWTCSGTPATAGCTPGPQNGDITDNLINLPAMSSVRYVATAIVYSSATATITNIASVKAYPTVIDSTTTDDFQQVSTTVTREADLIVTKVTSGTVIPGAPYTYTVTVINQGPSDANAVSVVDSIPALVTSFDWTCFGSGCGLTSSGTDVPINIDDGYINAGASLVYKITALVPSSQTSGTVTNRVSVQSFVFDSDTSNNYATTVDILVPSAAVTVTKDDGRLTLIPGLPTTYSVTVRNDGPTDLISTQVSVVDNFDTTIIPTAAWTCVAGAGATCGIGFSSGTVLVDSLLAIQAGSQLTYLITAQTYSSSTSSLSNWASARVFGSFTHLQPSLGYSGDSNTLVPTVDTIILKDTSQPTVVPGTLITYNIVAYNMGPSDAPSATVEDIFPGAVFSSVSWSCQQYGAAFCANTAGTTLNENVKLLAGGSVVFTVTALVNPSTTSDFTNTASITVPITDSNLSNNLDTVFSTVTPILDLSITKSYSSSGVAGTLISYSLLVTNTGPSTAISTVVSVVDQFSALLEVVAWTCTPSVGASCSSGTGNLLTDNSITLPQGGNLLYKVTAQITSSTTTSSLLNTASVITYGVTSDSRPDNDDSAVATPIVIQADLSITKANSGTFIPGLPTTYTIIVVNNGPSDATQVSVFDFLDSPILSASWSCAAATPSSCGSSSVGSNDIVIGDAAIVVGQALTVVIEASLSSSSRGSVINTASVRAPSIAIDNDPSNNYDSMNNPLVPIAAVSVSKTDGLTNFIPGTAPGITYSISVENLGPSTLDFSSVSVVDFFDLTKIQSVSWTCVGGTGTLCGITSGTTSLIHRPDFIQPYKTLTYHVTALIFGSAFTSTLTNTVSGFVIGGVFESGTSDSIGIDTTDLVPEADLVITKDDGSSTAIPGAATLYSITVVNRGPSDVVVASVVDIFPNSVVQASTSWTCVAQGPASCYDASGFGDITQYPRLYAGGSVLYVVNANIYASATGSITNSASVGFSIIASNPGDDVDTDINTLTPQLDLSISKTFGSILELIAGNTITYSITVTNDGPSDGHLNSVSVFDPFSDKLTGVSWTCTPLGLATCSLAGTGLIADDTVYLPVSASVRYVATATIYSSVTGTVDNTASVTAYGDLTDTDSTSNVAATSTSIAQSYDIVVTKSDGAPSTIPGDMLTYTITIFNDGPSDSRTLSVTDLFSADLQSIGWDCFISGSGTCFSPQGSNTLDDITVFIAAKSSAFFTVTAKLRTSARGSLINSVSVAFRGVDDSIPNNNYATDTNTITPITDLSIGKSAAATALVPGLTVTFTISVRNRGPSDAYPQDFSVFDYFETTTLFNVAWTCIGFSGATCTPSGSSVIEETNAYIPALGAVRYIATAQIYSSATGSVTNTATVASTVGLDSTTPNNAVSVTYILTPQSDISINKYDFPALTEWVPGTLITYYLAVTNNGPSDTGYGPRMRVFDFLDGMHTSSTASWSCTTYMATCFVGTAIGDLDDNPIIVAGGSVLYKLTTLIQPSATGVLSNTASVIAATSHSDGVAGNDGDTDTNILFPVADLSIVKDDGVTIAYPGSVHTYTITIINDGPSDALFNTITVSDVFPVIFESAVWTCTATGSSSCGATTGGGDIQDLPQIRTGEFIQYFATGTITSSVVGSITNTASITTLTGLLDSIPANNVETDITTLFPNIDLSLTKTDGNTLAIPGLPITYTIDVTNSGPSDGLFGRLFVADYFSKICATYWNCTPLSASAFCDSVGGTGDLLSYPAILVGGSVRYTIVATVCSSATGDLDNIASATVTPGNTDFTPSFDTDSNTLFPVADLSITKTDGRVQAFTGAMISYTITVINLGPSDVPSSRISVTDMFDSNPAVDVWSWSCTAVAPSTCSGGTSLVDLQDSPAIVAGGSVTYVVLLRTLPSLGDSSIINYASVTLGSQLPGAPYEVYDSIPANDISNDITVLIPRFDISVTKTSNKGPTGTSPIASGGETITYSIMVMNHGPSDTFTDAILVEDVFPAKLETWNWQCVAVGPPATSCGSTVSGVQTNLNQLVTLPAGGSVFYYATSKINDTEVGQVVNIINTTLVIGNETMPGASNRGNNIETYVLSLTSASDVGIQIDDGTATAIPGSYITYTIRVDNYGPSRVDGTSLTLIDIFPAGFLSSWYWNCSSIALPSAQPATCGVTSGSSFDADPTQFIYSGAEYPQRSALQFELVGLINPAATGNVTNPVISDLLFSITDSNPSNDQDEDAVLLTPQADIGLTISLPSFVAGANVTYIFILRNFGPSDAPEVSLTINVPPQLSTFLEITCSRFGLSRCNIVSPTITTSLIVTQSDIKAGSAVRYLVTFLTSPLLNETVTVSGVSLVQGGVESLVEENNAATVSRRPTREANFVITKRTRPSLGVIPLGSEFTYVITVENTGPSYVFAKVMDQLPSYLIEPRWSCRGSLGATCGTFAPNSPVLVDSTLDLPLGGRVEYTLISVLDANNPINVVNTANVSSPDGSSANFTDTTPSDSGQADFAVAVSCPATSTVGTRTVWTIVVDNIGPDTRVAKLTAAIPPGTGSCTWTCQANVGETSCSDSGGSGAINERVSAAQGGRATFLFSCMILPAAAGTTVTGSATVATRGLDPVSSNNQDSAATQVAAISTCVQICADGSCGDNIGGCPAVGTDGSTIDFDEKGGFTLAAGNTELTLSFGDIKELDSNGFVIYAESLQDQDFNITQAPALSATGKTINNVNYTATLANGAFFRIAYYIFSEPDIYPVGSVVLDIAGATNKFSIIVADWPFEDFDVHSLQIDIGFETGGEQINDPCLLESSASNKKVTQSQFKTEDGVVAVQVLQFATLDGVETEVSGELTTELLILTTPSFFVDMIYDPDFSVLLGGGASTGACASADQSALLNASIAALSTAFGFAGLVIAGYIFYDKRKKYLRQAAREKAQNALKSGGVSVPSSSTWGAS